MEWVKLKVRVGAGMQPGSGTGILRAARKAETRKPEKGSLTSGLQRAKEVRVYRSMTEVQKLSEVDTLTGEGALTGSALSPASYNFFLRHQGQHSIFDLFFPSRL
jgi:hypothetical protein